MNFTKLPAVLTACFAKCSRCRLLWVSNKIRPLVCLGSGLFGSLSVVTICFVVTGFRGFPGFVLCGSGGIGWSKGVGRRLVSGVLMVMIVKK